MKRVVVTAPGEFGIEEAPEPTPEPDQAVLRLVSAGICLPGQDIGCEIKPLRIGN